MQLRRNITQDLYYVDLTRYSAPVDVECISLLEVFGKVGLAKLHPTIGSATCINGVKATLTLLLWEKVHLTSSAATRNRARDKY